MFSLVYYGPIQFDELKYLLIVINYDYYCRVTLFF